MESQRSRIVIDFRLWIARCLTWGAVLTAVLVVTALTWGVLQSMDDAAAAASLVGLMYVLLACWGLNFVAMVALLAAQQVHASGAEDDAEAQRPAPPDS